MEYMDTVAYDAKVKIIKALAHRSRLMIVDFLADGPKCVCELRDVLTVDHSTVSKHLSVLRNAGIVKSEKRGLQVYYELRCPCVLKFVECIEEVVKVDFEEMAEMLR